MWCKKIQTLLCNTLIYLYSNNSWVELSPTANKMLRTSLPTVRKNLKERTICCLHQDDLNKSCQPSFLSDFIIVTGAGIRIQLTLLKEMSCEELLVFIKVANWGSWHIISSEVSYPFSFFWEKKRGKGSRWPKFLPKKDWIRNSTCIISFLFFSISALFPLLFLFHSILFSFASVGINSWF